MNWLWLNISLATPIFLAVTLIPLWLVIKHPDTGPPAPAAARRSDGRAAAVLAVRPAAPAAGPQAARHHQYGRQLQLASQSRQQPGCSG